MDSCWQFGVGVELASGAGGQCSLKVTAEGAEEHEDIESLEVVWLLCL